MYEYLHGVSTDSGLKWFNGGDKLLQEEKECIYVCIYVCVRMYEDDSVRIFRIGGYLSRLFCTPPSFVAVLSSLN